MSEVGAWNEGKSARPADKSLGILDNALVTAAYARWAPFYDFFFAAVMHRGRQAAAAAVNRHKNGHILDVG
ncbi:MAG TPA: hypothetical protein VGG12_09760, partial [Methylovirgula sp.]